ncbi:MAG TPA: bifunctional 3-(3-hydroxy-phenyl)propionate/3-hydroxycinnamic acid hydroxylase [Candidatus Limnocylindrales bacterium]|nr:bifunctional 3-(3-hydroxy-phenyl)propionate/3-hydroxycinnamic acid hydroxylase [Candidatus Limnocylindrales bacterium]
MDETYDVAIVGYGPVGQVLSILLGQHGWRVGVFEKQPLPYPLPRAAHFDHEVARILQACGLGADLPRLTEPADIYEWTNASGQTLLRIGTAGDGLSGWPEANMFSQPALEDALDRQVRRLRSVRVERACEVVALRQNGHDVDVDLARLDGGRRTVRARYVVGCDGANSFVRSTLDTSTTDLGFFFDWLIVDVIPHEQRVWHPINAQICDPARPTTVISAGPGRRRWEFMKLPGEDIEELNCEETAWRLLEPWDVRPSNATLERHAVYRFQARWVDRWRNGRLLLAGDAAHQMPPFAGQGMCSGMRDAANLAWKLSLVLSDRACDDLLDTYQSERVPQVRQVIDLSIELGKIICVADRAQAAARDEVMTAAAASGDLTPPMPSPAIGPGVGMEDDALAGELFLQAPVRRHEASGLFDDVIGRGFTLVSTQDDPARHLDAESAACFEALGGICAHVARGGAIDDVDGRYERWFAANGAGVVLVRPDFHVFGSAASVGDAPRLIAALRERLSKPAAKAIGGQVST